MQGQSRKRHRWSAPAGSTNAGARTLLLCHAGRGLARCIACGGCCCHQSRSQARAQKQRSELHRAAAPNALQAGPEVQVRLRTSLGRGNPLPKPYRAIQQCRTSTQGEERAPARCVAQPTPCANGCSMKLRLRLGSATHKVDVPDSSTLQDLEEHVAAELTHGVKPVLGLNKTVRTQRRTCLKTPVPLRLLAKKSLCLYYF